MTIFHFPGINAALATIGRSLPGARLRSIVEMGRNDDARVEAAELMRINLKFSLAAKKQMSIIKQPLRDRLYADMAKAGLK